MEKSKKEETKKIPSTDFSIFPLFKKNLRSNFDKTQKSV